MEARVAKTRAMQARDGAVDEFLVAGLDRAAGPIGTMMSRGDAQKGVSLHRFCEAVSKMSSDSTGEGAHQSHIPQPCPRW